MVNGLHLYRAFIQSASQYCQTFSHPCTHSPPTAESTTQGDSQRLGSSQGYRPRSGTPRHSLGGAGGQPYLLPRVQLLQDGVHVGAGVRVGAGRRHAGPRRVRGRGGRVGERGEEGQVVGVQARLLLLSWRSLQQDPGLWNTGSRAETRVPDSHSAFIEGGLEAKGELVDGIFTRFQSVLVLLSQSGV